jgi:hypothetical protein
MRFRSPAGAASKRHALLLVVLTALFVLRVGGQALQRWYPLHLLPPFDAWQGSNAPYPLLLSMQVLLVAVMFRVCWRTARGTNTPHRRLGVWLAACGVIYMAGSVLRIAIGLTVADAPAWFSAWISAVFHLVLAGFVLTVAHHHLRARYLGP